MSNYIHKSAISAITKKLMNIIKSTITNLECIDFIIFNYFI